MLSEDRGSGFEGKVSMRGWMIWGTAALFYLYEFFVRVAPSAMEPELQAHFGLTAAALGAAAGTYYLIYSPMQLLSGTIIDKFGPKRVLLISALVCTFGAFLQIAGDSSMFLVAARFCQGLGSAFAFVGTMYVAAEWFPRSMLAMISGLTTSLGMAGAIIGNAGIANMVEDLGWQSALLVAGVVGLAITALIAVVVPSHEPADFEQPAEKKPHVLAALKIVYSNPQSWYIGIVGATLYMPLAIIGALWGAEYVISLTGATKLEAASAVSMMYVGWLIGGPIAGYLSDRFNARRLFLVGASIATFVVTMFIALTPSLPLSAMFGVLLLLGFASTSQVVCFAAAVEHNPHSVTGTSLAATNMIIMLMGGMGEWLFGELLDFFNGPAAAGVFTAEAFHLSIGLLPAMSLLGLVCAMRLKDVPVARASSVPEAMAA